MRGRTTLSVQLRVAMAMAVAVVVSAGPASAQGIALFPGDPGWILTENSEVVRVDGRDVIGIRAGRALRPDIPFADGTVEFEMRTRRVRSFVGITFRGRGAEPHEDIYLRPHKSGLPDAIQYTPRFAGQGQWQLYHGPYATGVVHFTPGEWQRVRLVVKGDRAAVFVGDAPQPQLVVDELRSDGREGTLGFWAAQPGAAPTDPWALLLSDIVVRPGEVEWDFSPVEPEPSPEGVIREWALSETFVRSGEDVLELLPEVVSGPWRVAATEPSGLLPIELHVRRPDQGTPAVLAGLELETDRARTVRLDLGFSDRATVFLNGRLVYSGRHDFSTNFPRRQGLITLDQAALHLPLDPGRNHVVVAVSESFGGWGLISRITDREGVEVRPGAAAGASARSERRSP